MYIRELQLRDFRSYENLAMEFSEGTNILYGDNAQGKTNILEALYMVATTKSHRGVKDRDLIRFGNEEGHIRAVIIKNGIDYQVDMHLRSSKTKGIAINGQRIKRASQLIGLLHIVFFSPEDLTIVKNGPANRRRFIDMELCQLDESYLYNLNHYNKIVEQRNKLLHDIYYTPALESTLEIWDDQLADYGEKIILRRQSFIEDLNKVIGDIHLHLSGGKEHLSILYEPDTAAQDFRCRIRASHERDKYLKSTSVGPHKDDFSFISNDIDLRKFGSQGQQRTCALSLKLAEIRLVKDLIGDSPVLMLDDVLSELDSNRQNYLLDHLGNIQTMITCTGLDEFVNNRFSIDKLYRVENGTVRNVNAQDAEQTLQEEQAEETGTV
ncbi:MAG: DNA replication/repair protein RecF [Lachnospiraceae bacterium]|nr:DNA replication/repair protein RecF [Lachnospiraceae bacterium]